MRWLIGLLQIICCWCRAVQRPEMVLTTSPPLSTTATTLNRAITSNKVQKIFTKNDILKSASEIRLYEILEKWSRRRCSSKSHHVNNPTNLDRCRRSIHDQRRLRGIRNKKRKQVKRGRLRTKNIVVKKVQAINRMKELRKRRKRPGQPDVSSLQDDETDQTGDYKPKGLEQRSKFIMFSVIGVVAIVWQ